MKYIIYILIVITATACGKQDSKKPATDYTPVDSYATGDTLVVEALGANMSEMRFNKKTITVPPHTDITIALVNKSTDATMPHNFVIVDKGRGNDVGQAGMKHKGNSYVKPNDALVLAYSPLAGIGETVYFSFTTPERGEYDFICSYPGHWGMMKGSFLIE